MRTTAAITAVLALTDPAGGIVLDTTGGTATVTATADMAGPLPGSPLHTAVSPRQVRIDRLSSLLCELQPRLRWKRGREWTPAICTQAATAYVDEAAFNVKIVKDPSTAAVTPSAIEIHDLLAVAISIQESDLVDTAARHEKSGKTDNGLMGVRCPSAFSRGIKCDKLISIPVNIRMGVAEMRHWKTTPLRETEIRRYRQPDGRITASAISKPCDHATSRGHGWWNHYNNGLRRSKDAFKARYDRRVGSIYRALCAKMGEVAVEMPAHLDDALDVRTKGLVETINKAPWIDPALPAPTLVNVAR